MIILLAWRTDMFDIDGIKQWWLDLAQAIDINFLQQNRYMLIVRGFGITMQITFFSLIIGVILGFLLAIMRLSPLRILHAVAGVYIDIIRGTPIVVQILIIYFIVFRSINWPKNIIGIIAFGMNSGAYVAEIIRGGLLAVDYGQTEAGRSLGLSYPQTLRLIIVPQAFKIILPSLTNEFIVLMKETAVVGYIALMDLTKATDIIRSQTYNPYLPLLAGAVVYYVVIKAFTILFAVLERRMRESDNRHQSA